MKKFAILLIIVVLMLCATGCKTVRRRVELSDKQGEIQTIEIYALAKEYDEGDISALRSENTPIYLLEDEQYGDFLEELLSLDFEEEVCYLPIPLDGGCDCSGMVVSIVYADGGYDIIAKDGQFSYGIEGGKERYEYSTADYCGVMDWDTFLEKYIVESIENS